MNLKKIILLLFLLQPLTLVCTQEGWTSRIYRYCSESFARTFNAFFYDEKIIAHERTAQEQEKMNALHTSMSNLSRVIYNDTLEDTVEHLKNVQNKASVLSHPIKKDIFDYIARFEKLPTKQASLNKARLALANKAALLAKNVYDADMYPVYYSALSKERFIKYGRIASVYALIGIFGYAAYQYDAFPKI